MAKFDLESYETVETRLAKFWKAHPEGRVLTRKLELTDKNEGRRFEVIAEIYFDREDTRPVATGHAEEIVGASPVNRTSALENCETSAIGRALANCGFASEGKRPSRQEMEKVERYQNEPRKPVEVQKVYTPDQLAKAESLIEFVKVCPSKEELKRIWDTEKEILEAPVNGDSVANAIRERIKALQ